MTQYKAPRIPAWITDPVWRERLSRWLAASIKGFHGYAGWLVRLSWWRFTAYALALLIAANVISQIPPFKALLTDTVEYDSRPMPEPPEAPDFDEIPDMPEKSDASGHQDVDRPPEDFEIKIGKDGVRIGPPGGSKEAPQVDISPKGLRIVTPAEAGASGAASRPRTVLDIQLPKEVTEQIRKEMEQAHRQASAERAAATQEYEAAVKERQEAIKKRAAAEASHQRKVAKWEREMEIWRKATRDGQRRVRVEQTSDALVNLAVLLLLASALIKATYKGRAEAEAKAAAAEETAEAEALKRQLVEARLNTMQAQVEPHFLFNTLASIDHLIEVDPKRASQMQKNLIALLRATMPTMREANGTGSGLRDLKREMAVVRPYLEILQVRMEERLQVEIDVPDGLLSAEFPPMIIQGLVENAIKHGLEPKPEGGSLAVRARIEHGKLVVEVADTGLGFGRAATSGTGVGLANTRERLQLLYGNKASLTVAENQPCGTLIRISVPYKSNEAEGTA
ncbi:histidine kinase [Inhella sp.]|uniref:histidine kinase n=1 Tax=Inhella sp. TaxID=1921806 RepID=UPI0035B3C40E